MATSNSEHGEFSGAPGLIQPEPHELTSAELAMLERKLDPADPSDSVEAARARVNGENQQG